MTRSFGLSNSREFEETEASRRSAMIQQRDCSQCNIREETSDEESSWTKSCPESLARETSITANSLHSKISATVEDFKLRLRNRGSSKMRNGKLTGESLKKKKFRRASNRCHSAQQRTDTHSWMKIVILNKRYAPTPQNRLPFPKRLSRRSSYLYRVEVLQHRRALRALCVARTLKTVEKNCRFREDNNAETVGAKCYFLSLAFLSEAPRRNSRLKARAHAALAGPSTISRY